uniref:Putative secreted peptide n=1 Tax=Anopheles braziliensis TaxID=58242 RepID=A0A2M3ZSX4_9DIPT
MGHIVLNRSLLLLLLLLLLLILLLLLLQLATTVVVVEIELLQCRRYMLRRSAFNISHAPIAQKIYHTPVPQIVFFSLRAGGTVHYRHHHDRIRAIYATSFARD